MEEAANSGSYGSPPPATASRGDQTFRGGGETYRGPRPTLPHSRHFGHQMPSRQVADVAQILNFANPRPAKVPRRQLVGAKACRLAAPY